ncbi:MAG: magnesium transporter [Desulfurococcales archaeon]|nr:magnesium transporter [Desulfurococcales archaeon]
MGLHTANVGDFFNILLMATFTKFLVERPEALALLPSLAAMRGAIVTSMASRVSTSLHLGVLEASTVKVLKRELPTLIVLALSTSVYAAIIVALSSGYPVSVEVSIAALSGFISILFLAPISAYIATLGFKRNLDPDRYMAPVLTVIGDISTSPTIVAVVLLLNAIPYDEAIIALSVSYASIALFFILIRGFPGKKRLLYESLGALGIVGFLEAYAGNSLVGYSTILLAVGVLHAIPSIMEDVGAAVSVTASKLSTLSHLYGMQDTLKMTPAIVSEVLLGSITPLLVLSGIAIGTAGIAGVSAPVLQVVSIVLISGLLGIFIFSIMALSLVYLSFRVGVDPDNVVVPLLTSIVDALTIPLIVGVSALLV